MKILKVRYAEGSMKENLGCEKAPDLILKNFDDLDIDSVDVNRGNVDVTMKNISESEGDFYLGGDHSLTYGAFKGFASKYKNPGIIVFDAHPDLEVNAGSVTHEDFLRKLIEEDVVKKENVILVGIRDSSDNIGKNEKEFMRGMKVFRMSGIFRNEENVCDSIMELGQEFDGLYLSIDIDVVDPAFAPGTRYLEPGGLNSSQLFYFLKRIKCLKNLKRIDLVEINPDKDSNGLTIELGRRVVNFFV